MKKSTKKALIGTGIAVAAIYLVAQAMKKKNQAATVTDAAASAIVQDKSGNTFQLDMTNNDPAVGFAVKVNGAANGRAIALQTGKDGMVYKTKVDGSIQRYDAKGWSAVQAIGAMTTGDNTAFNMTISQ